MYVCRSTFFQHLKVVFKKSLLFEISVRDIIHIHQICMYLSQDNGSDSHHLRFLIKLIAFLEDFFKRVLKVFLQSSICNYILILEMWVLKLVIMTI